MNQEIDELNQEIERLKRENEQLEREVERSECLASMVQLLDTLGIDLKNAPAEGRRRLLEYALYKIHFLTPDFKKLALEKFGWAFGMLYEAATETSVFDLDSHWEAKLDPHWKQAFPHLAYSLANHIWLICYRNHVPPEIEDLSLSIAQELPLPDLSQIPPGTLTLHAYIRDWIWGWPFIKEGLFTEGGIRIVRSEDMHSEIQEVIDLQIKDERIILPIPDCTQVLSALVYKAYDSILRVHSWHELTSHIYNKKNNQDVFLLLIAYFYNQERNDSSMLKNKLRQSGHDLDSSFFDKLNEASKRIQKLSWRIAENLSNDRDYEDAGTEAFMKWIYKDLAEKPLHIQIQKLGVTKKAIKYNIIDELRDVLRQPETVSLDSEVEQRDGNKIPLIEILNPPEGITPQKQLQQFNANRADIEAVLSRHSNPQVRKKTAERRFTVLCSRVWGLKITEIAKELEEDEKTIDRDLKAIREAGGQIKKILESG